MVSESKPGVYIEEISSGVHPIEATITSTATFVGATKKGPDGSELGQLSVGPDLRATQITSWQEFQDIYGAFVSAGYLAESVHQFFYNGGRQCYIIRLRYRSAETDRRTVYSDPDFKYVPVRRTAIMLRRSIYDGIQWAVFEPNDYRLWSSLRINIGAFMNGLFKAGAFQGKKVSDAYFVRCGLGDTMTQGDIDRGQVIVLAGFAALKPAEFVIVRIQQKAGQN